MQPPKKNILAYLLPFFIIGLIITGAFFYIRGNNINFQRVIDIVKPPQIQSKIKVAYTKGNISILSWGETDWRKLSESTSIGVGDIIQVPTDGRMAIKFFNDSEIRLEKNTTLSITRVDTDSKKADHIALELQQGKIWGRIDMGQATGSDLIVTTTNQVIQASEKVVLEVASDPESIRVIGGNIKLSLAEKIGTQRKPLGVFTISGGEQMVFDNVAQEKLGEKNLNILTPISETFLSSEWYIWNDEIEQNLGYLVDPATVSVSSPEKMELIEGDDVRVETPKSGSKVGTSVVVKGKYNSETIQDIYINETKAIKSVDGEWEATVEVSSNNTSLNITATDVEGITRMVAEIPLNVQDQGPENLAVTFPKIDENSNGQHNEADLELLGSVGTTATKICVSHNDDTPYCLKGFNAGDETWRYVAAIKYSNFAEGKNKYTVTAFDNFDNTNATTVYIFNKEPKPSKKIEEEPLAKTPSASITTRPNKPEILTPSTNGHHETTTPIVKIQGRVGEEVSSIFVNDTKIRYAQGDLDFSYDHSLQEGENLLKVIAVDAKGRKSKTTLYRVIYTNTGDIEEPTATP